MKEELAALGVDTEEIEAPLGEEDESPPRKMHKTEAG